MPQFSGIIPPIVTPLKAVDQLASQAVGRVCEHLIAGRVSGIFALGTTGEGPSLTYQIRYEMVECVCEAVAGRIPVLVGITDTSLVEAIHLAEHAAANNAAAVVAAPPYYFPTDQTGLIEWYTALADQSPLPVMIYNMPGCVGIEIAVETVERLSQHPNIIGVKDSSGNLENFRALCNSFSDSEFAVFMGPEELIPEAVAAGADGGVSGGGNLLPNVYVDMFAAARANDAAEVDRLMKIVKAVFAGIYNDPSGKMNLIPALKLAMEHCGLCSRLAAPPLRSLEAAHQDQVLHALPEVLKLAGSPLTVAPRV